MFVNLFDAKVFDYEYNLYRAPGMAPKPWHGGGLKVAGCVQAFAKEVVGKVP